MKNVILVAVLVSSVAFAANATMSNIDTDGDGMASLIELQVPNPDLTENVFNEADMDQDGLLNAEELAIAVEAGTLEYTKTDF